MSAQHSGKSGFAVIEGNRQAFTDRIALADNAQKTLDVQYYIWSPDTIGRILGDHVVRAAQRGVRVRFLIDDLNVTTPDSAMLALAKHPNIDVRLFNPRVWRSMRKADLMVHLRRLNHRMHNKAMIMDNACAVIGGRNIADEYFGLHESRNMRDLDIVAVGPIVKKVSSVFDEFWNSPAAIPVQNMVRDPKGVADFQKQADALRDSIQPGQYPYPLDLDLAEVKAHLSKFESRFIWADGEVLYDSYESLKSPRHGATVVSRLSELFAEAKKSLHIEAAYFVLREPGLQVGRDLEGRGVEMRVLTNSLASNNQPKAQSGHAKHRQKILESGAELFEFRPDSAAAHADVAPAAKDSVIGIHTKAFVIDGTQAFVGSYNLDPRSAEINSEIGLLVKSPAFAARVSRFLDEGIRPENAYRVTLDSRGRPQWQTHFDGKPRTWSQDPETTFGQRLMEKIYMLLPIQSQL